MCNKFEGIDFDSLWSTTLEVFRELSNVFTQISWLKTINIQLVCLLKLIDRASFQGWVTRNF